MTPDHDAAIEAGHWGCEIPAKEGDNERYYEVNRQFHEAIYRASRNEFLTDQALALHKRLSAYRRIQLRARNRLLQSLQEHAGVLEVIRAGDEQLVASGFAATFWCRASGSLTWCSVLPGPADPLL